MNARTTESLLARRALAEKATPGEWITTGINSVHGGYRNRLIYPDENPDVLIASMNNTSNSKCAEDADHIVASNPSTVMDDIDEILRLREKVERLEKEADWLARICAEQMLDGVDEASVQWWREKARESARKDVKEDSEEAEKEQTCRN